MPGGKLECGMCMYCVHGQYLDEPVGGVVPVNEHKALAIFRAFPEFKKDPRIMVRAALGVGHAGSRDLINGSKESVDMARRLSRANPLFGCMVDSDFWVSKPPTGPKGS